MGYMNLPIGLVSAGGKSRINSLNMANKNLSFLLFIFLQFNLYWIVINLNFIAELIVYAANSK